MARRPATLQNEGSVGLTELTLRREPRSVTKKTLLVLINARALFCLICNAGYIWRFPRSRKRQPVSASVLASNFANHAHRSSPEHLPNPLHRSEVLVEFGGSGGAVEASVVPVMPVVTGLPGLVSPAVTVVSDVVPVVSEVCLLYTSPSPRDRTRSRMPSSA